MPSSPSRARTRPFYDAADGALCCCFCYHCLLIFLMLPTSRLPGGYGTLDETLEITTWQQLGQWHNTLCTCAVVARLQGTTLITPMLLMLLLLLCRISHQAGGSAERGGLL